MRRSVGLCRLSGSAGDDQVTVTAASASRPITSSTASSRTSVTGSSSHVPDSTTPGSTALVRDGDERLVGPDRRRDTADTAVWGRATGGRKREGEHERETVTEQSTTM